MSGYLKMAYTLTFGRYQQIMAARDRAIEGVSRKVKELEDDIKILERKASIVCEN
jgi:hypothetical protein